MESTLPHGGLVLMNVASMNTGVCIKSRLQRFLAALLLVFFLPAVSQSLSAKEPISPVQFDPSDLYFQGYLASRAGEKLEATGDHLAAAEKYRRADEMFSAIRQYYPDWRTDMVMRRSDKTSAALVAIHDKAEGQLNKQRDVVAELEGGRIPVGSNPQGDLHPSILKVDPVASRRLKEAEAEVQRLRLLLHHQQQDAERLRHDQRNGAGIAARQLKQLQDKSNQELAAVKAEIQRLKAEASVQQHHSLEADQNAKLLKAEQAKVARLQQEAQQLREQRAHLDRLYEGEAARQLLEARNEIRRLKREATMARIQADAQITRLKKQTGELEAEALQKIQQHKDLAQSAEQHAQKEIARLIDLKGSERVDVEKEIARLNRIAAKAKEDARKAHALYRARSAKKESEAEAEIEKLRAFANKTGKEAEAMQLNLELKNSQNDLKIKELKASNQDLEKERKRTEAMLIAAEAEVRRYKERLAKAPLESGVETLNHRIKKLEQERGAMALSLQQSENGYAQAMGRIAGLEKDLRQARQQAVDLNRDLIVERDSANAVVSGQRRQLKQMQKLLDEKSEELTKANQTIAQLQQELTQSKDAYAQLRNERDTLIMERDQMAALLKLGEEGRMKDLIDQNMGMAKKLREANEVLERMNRESHADKDAITEALRDLAIAKSQINRLRLERHKQEQHIQGLEQRLKDEGMALASGDASADPQEVALLRDIIRRQLRMQAARRQARKLLMATLNDLGNQDEELSEAVEMLNSQELVLTPEEQKLIADRQVDGEFVSPFARDRASVDQATASLKHDIDVFDRAAKKAFVAGRLHPTRELYEMILDQHPGHTPTLCKMGVVHLKLENHQDAVDTFQRAIELDTNNAYAHRMLSYSLLMDERNMDAEIAARKSVELDPNDAKTQMLLATLCFRMDKIGDAESHFKGAINADPLSSEPYYNLALIYSGTGRIEQAQEYYRQALERGALPDPKLEQDLAAQYTPSDS